MHQDESLDDLACLVSSVSDHRDRWLQRLSLRGRRRSVSPAGTALLGLVLVACGTPSTSPAASGSLSLPLPTTQATPSASSPADARLTEFKIHAIAGLTQNVELGSRLQASTTSLPEVRAAVFAIAQWALAQSEWLDANPPEPCYQHAFAAYELSLKPTMDGALALDDLMSGSGTASPAVIEEAAGLIKTGMTEMAEAMSVLDSTTCTTSSVASPEASWAALPPDPADAYAIVAADVNGRHAELLKVGSDAKAYGTGLAALVDYASGRLREITFPASLDADVQRLHGGTRSIASNIGNIAFTGIDDTDQTELRTAMILGMFDLRDATEAIRSTLGLSARDAHDLL